MRDTIERTLTVTLEAAALEAALKFTARALEPKGTLPMLANVFFPGDGTMVSTNLDQRAIWQFAGVEPHVPFTVPHKSLLKALKGANKGALVYLTYDAGTGKVAINYDGLRSNVSGLPPEDFPCANVQGASLAGFRMDGAYFRDALRFVAPCISTEETRYYLNGIFLHPANGVATMVATDGHRLGLFPMEDQPWAGERHDGQGVIIPTHTVKALLDTLGTKPTGDVAVEVRKHSVRVACENWVYESRVVDGAFPDYTRVIPQVDTTTSLDLTDTLTKVKRLHGLSARGAKAVKIDLMGGVISYTDPDRDTHEMTVDAKVASGLGPQTFGVNMDYLKAALETFSDAGAATIIHGGRAALDPMRFTSPKTGKALWVIMPMHVPT